MTRKFSSISVETTLASSIGATGTTITVASGTGSALLGGVTLAAGNVDQFTLAIDPDTTNEEIVFATANAGDSFTIVRGRAGSTAITHGSGATVRHVLTSDDLSWFESNTSPVTSFSFKGSTSGSTAVQATAVASGTVTLPAATDTLVGRATADTLTNKTLTAPVINLATNAQTGTTYTFVAADAGKLVTASNASAQTYSIPTNASVSFAVGTVINIIQAGTGQVTIQAVSSGTTTILSNGASTAAPKLRVPYSSASLIKVATDTWYVVGDIV